jgi:hypothetical protein
MVIATSGDINIYYYKIISLSNSPYNFHSFNAYIAPRVSDTALIYLRGLFIINENNVVSLI